VALLFYSVINNDGMETIDGISLTSIVKSSVSTLNPCGTPFVTAWNGMGCMTIKHGFSLFDRKTLIYCRS